jgi:CRP-like cAMP-binding protein
MAAKKPIARGLPHAFDVQQFLDSAGLSRRVVRFARGAHAFAQGALATSVFYIQSGQVKLSVVSRSGREAVVAMLWPGDFFGEGCLPGSPGAWERRLPCSRP